MGNVVVWKPSPMNVYPSYLVHKILLEAGLPEGVVELVNGDAEMITKTVLAHREFAALNFIGSSDVFRSIYAKIGQGMGEGRYREFPRMVGETSGKNFHLIHPSADITNAAKHTVRGSFEYAGQKCSACSRIYVPESQAPLFFDEMKKELDRIRVGPPEDFSAFTGPVIDRKAFDRITKAMDGANKDDRLETIVGGTYDGSTGYFIDPTIYASKTPDHPMFNQELFGPVLIAYVYPDNEFDATLDVIDGQGGNLALTGSFHHNLCFLELLRRSTVLLYTAANMCLQVTSSPTTKWRFAKPRTDCVTRPVTSISIARSLLQSSGNSRSAAREAAERAIRRVALVCSLDLLRLAH